MDCPEIHIARQASQTN